MTTLESSRLAGHVANFDFWIAEVKHCASAIEGYADRRRKMVEGTREAYFHESEREAIERPFLAMRRQKEPDIPDVSTDWDAIERESDELREQLFRSAKRFVQRCVKSELITMDKLFEIEDQLGRCLR